MKKAAHALEQERPDVLKKREEWFDAQPDLAPEWLVFIDETSLSTRMAWLRGWALRGEGCRSGVPHGHWKTTTFTGAFCTTGLTVLFVHDGAMNSVVFQTYIERVLMPTLRPGDIVIFDNLPAHRMPGARRGHDDVPAALQPGFQSDRDGILQA